VKWNKQRLFHSDITVPMSDITVPMSDITVPMSDITVPMSDITVPMSDITVPMSSQSKILLNVRQWKTRFFKRLFTAKKNVKLRFSLLFYLFNFCVIYEMRRYRYNRVIPLTIWINKFQLVIILTISEQS
jgi:hypothetical protein